MYAKNVGLGGRKLIGKNIHALYVKRATVSVFRRARTLMSLTRDFRKLGLLA